MNGEKLIVFSDPPNERPELEFILSGCTTDDERKAIVKLFTRSLKVILAALAFSSQFYSGHTQKRLNQLPRDCAKPSEPNLLISVTFC